MFRLLSASGRVHPKLYPKGYESGERTLMPNHWTLGLCFGSDHMWGKLFFFFFIYWLSDGILRVCQPVRLARLQISETDLEGRKTNLLTIIIKKKLNENLKVWKPNIYLQDLALHQWKRTFYLFESTNKLKPCRRGSVFR